jgi:hypothetical protein
MLILSLFPSRILSLECLSNEYLRSTDCCCIFRLINHNKEWTGSLCAFVTFSWAVLRTLHIYIYLHIHVLVNLIYVYMLLFKLKIEKESPRKFFLNLFRSLSFFRLLTKKRTKLFVCKRIKLTKRTCHPRL